MGTRTPLKPSSRLWTVRMSHPSSKLVRRRKSACHAVEVAVVPLLPLAELLLPLQLLKKRKRSQKTLIWEDFSEMTMTIEHHYQSTLLASKKVIREVEKL